MASKEKRIQLITSEKARRMLKIYAAENDMAISEVIREALTEYFQQRGYEVDFSVPQHGGSRKENEE